MEKKPSQKVNVEIFGDTYPFKTDGDPEELKRLAAIVDERRLDTRKIAVLAAMQMASEYADLKKDYDELVQLLEDK